MKWRPFDVRSLKSPFLSLLVMVVLSTTMSALATGIPFVMSLRWALKLESSTGSSTGSVARRRGLDTIANDGTAMRRASRVISSFEWFRMDRMFLLGLFGSTVGTVVELH